MNSNRKFFILLVTVIATLGAGAIDLAPPGETGTSSGLVLGDATHQAIMGARLGSAQGATVESLQQRRLKKSASTTGGLRLPPLAWPRRI